MRRGQGNPPPANVRQPIPSMHDMFLPNTPPAAVDCGPLSNPENGLVTVSGTTFGNTATYTCNSNDYIVLGEPTRDCRDDGRWNCFAPTCAPSELKYSIMMQSSLCDCSLQCSGKSRQWDGLDCSGDSNWSGCYIHMQSRTFYQWRPEPHMYKC